MVVYFPQFSLNFPEWHSWISISLFEHKWLQTAEHARQSKKDSRLFQEQWAALLIRTNQKVIHHHNRLQRVIYDWGGIENQGYVKAMCCSQGLLQECNQLCAEYLFQPDKHYDVSYDTGDKSIQCGRHVDVFKLWLMWKAKVWPTISLFKLNVFSTTIRNVSWKMTAPIHKKIKCFFFCGEVRKKEVEKKDLLIYLELRSRNWTQII